MKQTLKSGDEVDAVLSRKYHHWHKHELKRIKRGLNKRIRRDGKSIITGELA